MNFDELIESLRNVKDKKEHDKVKIAELKQFLEMQQRHLDEEIKLMQSFVSDSAAENLEDLKRRAKLLQLFINLVNTVE